METNCHHLHCGEGGTLCGEPDCSNTTNPCPGHPAGPYDPMGVTVYCDGSCQKHKKPRTVGLLPSIGAALMGTFGGA